jgi:hypothetical protein
MENNVRKTIIRSNSICILMLLFFLNSSAFLIYYLQVSWDWYDYEVAFRSRSWAFLIFFFASTTQLVLSVRVWFTHLDIAEDCITQIRRGALFSDRQTRGLRGVTSVVIHRRPTILFGRIVLNGLGFRIEITGPGFLLPGQRAAAREIAEFLGVPLTDERGHVIPYPV